MIQSATVRLTFLFFSDISQQLLDELLIFQCVQCCGFFNNLQPIDITFSQLYFAFMLMKKCLHGNM